MKSITEVEIAINNLVNDGALPQYLFAVICAKSSDLDSRCSYMNIVTKGMYRRKEYYKCSNIEYRISEIEIWKQDFC